MLDVVGLLLFLVCATIIAGKFRRIFTDLLEGRPLPGLTQFVLSIPAAVYLVACAGAIAALIYKEKWIGDRAMTLKINAAALAAIVVFFLMLIVALFMPLSTQALRLYAQLFYDLRDEHGHRRPALLMRIHNELDAQSAEDPSVRLLKIALATGIAGLRQVLHAQAPTPAATLDQLVEAELTRRLNAGELRTGDLVRLQANAIARERIALEVNRDAPAGLEGLKVIQRVVAMTAPSMVQVEQSQQQVDVSNAAITARLEAQRTVSASPVADDAGKGVAALTEMMGRHFRDGGK